MHLISYLPSLVPLLALPLVQVQPVSASCQARATSTIPQYVYDYGEYSHTYCPSLRS